MKKKELKPIVLNEEQNEYVDILGGVVDPDDTYFPDVACVGVGGACKEGCISGCKETNKSGGDCHESCKVGCAAGCEKGCISGCKSSNKGPTVSPDPPKNED